MEQHSCLTFTVDCGVMFKGVGVVLAGFILFVGSVYMLLTAVFGRYMAYLVARGRVLRLDDDPVRHLAVRVLVPRARDEDQPRSPRPRARMGGGLGRPRPGAVHAELASYPSGAYPEPNTADPLQAADLQAAQGVVTTYLANQANAQLGQDPLDYDGAPADTVHGR